MTAEKGNKVYTIDESLKARYQADGFDIKDEDGNVIAYGKGKTVSFDEYAKAMQENEALKAENETLKAGPAKKKAGE